jgi:hypothetical protein
MDNLPEKAQNIQKLIILKKYLNDDKYIAENFYKGF